MPIINKIIIKIVFDKVNLTKILYLINYKSFDIQKIKLYLRIMILSPKVKQKLISFNLMCVTIGRLLIFITLLNF